MAFSRGDVIEILSPIDVHSHFREPGGEAQETIASGTRAALFGGYIVTADMPNNPGGNETWTEEKVREKHQIASYSAWTDFAVIAGHDFSNPRISEYPGMIPLSIATKGYFGHTTGNTVQRTIEDPDVWSAYSNWTKIAGESGYDTPHMLHAEDTVGYFAARRIMKELGARVHWCHVSSTAEIGYVEKLKRDFPAQFTSGATPHHMLMTMRDADMQRGWNGRMIPTLKSEADADRVLDAVSTGLVDIIETDHAPHTTERKLEVEALNPLGHTDVGCETCFGVSGIEFALPMLTRLVQNKKLSIERLEDALHNQPLRMLGLKGRYRNAKTTLLFEPWQITESALKGRSSNTPYLGNIASSRVIAVTFRGQNRLNTLNPRTKIVTPKAR
jgi:dihydroorotase